MTGIHDINLAIDAAYDTLPANITNNTVRDNANVQPPNDRNTIGIRLTILHGDANQVTIGLPGRLRSTGTIMAMVHGPLEKGDKDVNLIAEQIAAKFRWRTVGGFVRCLTPNVSGGRRDEELDQWRVDVACPFFADGIVTPETST